MRSLTTLLLSIFGVLAYTAGASAVIIDVEGPTGTTIGASDQLEVDVVVDSEGVELVSYQFHVSYDSDLISFVSATATPPTQFYVYGVNPESPGAIIVDGTRFFGSLAVNQVVMTLVFHVADDIASTAEVTIAPYLVNYGSIDSTSDSTYTLIPIQQVSLGAGVTVTVPEPGVLALASAAICSLAFLRARRRRAG